MGEIITLAHGAGGRESGELINSVFLEAFGAMSQNSGEDAGIFGVDSTNNAKLKNDVDAKNPSVAVSKKEADFKNLNEVDSKKEADFKNLNSTDSKKEVDSKNLNRADSTANMPQIAVSTDSFVITPWQFSGGDIGKLSVCGSANDVAMGGAKPAYITAGFIIEEGFALSNLKTIATSFAAQLRAGGIKLLSADTKVIPRADATRNAEIFINTTCFGQVIKSGLSAANLAVGDSIIISGNLGTHGSVIYCARNEISLKASIKSDCAQLYPMLAPLLASNAEIHALRDATRGGLAAVLNEWAASSNAEIEVEEAALPVLEQVLGVCEILGLEPWSLANEGVCVLAAPKSCADSVLQTLRAHELGKNAAIIGEVVAKSAAPRVLLRNAWGARRVLDMPQGELLPRIC